jgi:hypothetical protein
MQGASRAPLDVIVHCTLYLGIHVGTVPWQRMTFRKDVVSSHVNLWKRSQWIRKWRRRWERILRNIKTLSNLGDFYYLCLKGELIQNLFHVTTAGQNSVLMKFAIGTLLFLYLLFSSTMLSFNNRLCSILSLSLQLFFQFHFQLVY